MPVFLASILIEYAWPLATVVVATYAAAVGRDWLQRRAVDIAKHVDERDAEWRAKFEALERELGQRITHVERNMVAAAPDFRPMGKNYNPRA